MTKHKNSIKANADTEVVTNCDNLVAIPIENRIIIIRGQHIMVDRDLAELYGVDTRSLNQAVKRNIDRFPETFRFQISDEEKEELVTNCDRFKTTIKFSPSNPYGTCMFSPNKELLCCLLC